MSASRPWRVALLYPGDRVARDLADPKASRFVALFDALAAASLAAEPAVWHDDFADEVAAQLRQVDAVLVWCNPIEDGRRRDRLDAVLDQAARAGVQVSAHPEAVRRLGTKDVLVETRDLPFGSDVHRVDSLHQLADELPVRLAAGPRVLKQHRGHSGIGVWRVESLGVGQLRVQHAERGCEPQTLGLDQLLALMAPYFVAEAGGHMIDQAWQPRLPEGMLRAYLVEDRVAGFGHQAVVALHPHEPVPGPRLYHGADYLPGQALKRQLEAGGVAQLCRRAGLDERRLPLLWDCDFLLAERDAQGVDRHVLCEINVSSVSPFPPSCIAPLVGALQRRLAAG